MASKEIIETLVTVFKIESEGVKRGAEEASRNAKRAEKGLADLGETAKSTNSTVKGLSGGFKQLSSTLQLAAIAIGAYNLINKSVNRGNLAERTGQDIKSITAYQRIMEKMGYSAEDASSSIQGFADAVGRWQHRGEMSEIIAAADQFFVSLHDEKGNLREYSDVLVEIGEGAVKRFGSAEKASKALAYTYGLNQKDIQFAVKSTARAELEAARAQAAADAPRMKRVHELNRLLQQQKQGLEVIGLEIMSNLAPSIQKAGEGISALTGYLAENGEALSLGTKAWVSYRMYGIHPVLGVLSTLISLISEAQRLLSGEWLEKGMKKGGALGEYIQRLGGASDPESGASVADVSPDKYSNSHDSFAKHPSSSGQKSGSVKDREKAIMDALIKEGLTKEQAAGAVGSMYQENATLDPGVNEKNPLVKGSKGGFGIMQWTGARRRKFQEVMGKKIEGSSLDEQIQYMLWEMRNDEKKGWNAVRSEKTASGAAAAHSRRVERPDERYAHIGKRQRNAEAVLASYGSYDYPSTAMIAAGRTMPTQAANNNQTIRIDNVTVNAGGADAKGVVDAFRDSMGSVYEFNSGAAV